MVLKELLASDNFFLLAGPCVIEGEEMAMDIAEKALKITQSLGIPYVFKGSYRKANRSRIDSFTGIGDEKALRILRKVGETFKIPVVTDIHEPVEADIAAEYVDVLQIPAFLCRQTELLEQGKEFASQYGMLFFETSAKESINVVEAFETMTKEIIKEGAEKKLAKPKENPESEEKIR